MLVDGAGLQVVGHQVEDVIPVRKGEVHLRGRRGATVVTAKLSRQEYAALLETRASGGWHGRGSFHHLASALIREVARAPVAALHRIVLPRWNESATIRARRKGFRSARDVDAAGAGVDR